MLNFIYRLFSPVIYNQGNTNIVHYLKNNTNTHYGKHIH